MDDRPYLRAPWTTVIGPNRYQRARLAFARRWLDEPAATHHDMLTFEAYPWHSTLINASLRPPSRVIDEGRGGRPYGWRVPDRAVRVYALPSGQRLVVEWHKGSAGPPSEAEVAVLKAALAEARG